MNVGGFAVCKIYSKKHADVFFFGHRLKYQGEEYPFVMITITDTFDTKRSNSLISGCIQSYGWRYCYLTPPRPNPTPGSFGILFPQVGGSELGIRC